MGNHNTQKNNQHCVVSVQKLSNSTPSKAVKRGGSIKVGIISEAPFKGIFSPTLVTDGMDQAMLQFG